MLYQWERFAACKGMDTSLFYDYEHRPRRDVPQEVIRACKACPVALSCLESAVLNDEFGYHAGTTAADRRRIRAELRHLGLTLTKTLVLLHRNEDLLAGKR